MTTRSSSSTRSSPAIARHPSTTPGRAATSGLVAHAAELLGGVLIRGGLPGGGLGDLEGVCGVHVLLQELHLLAVDLGDPGVVVLICVPVAQAAPGDGLSRHPVALGDHADHFDLRVAGHEEAVPYRPQEVVDDPVAAPPRREPSL